MIENPVPLEPLRGPIGSQRFGHSKHLPMLVAPLGRYLVVILVNSRSRVSGITSVTVQV